MPRSSMNHCDAGTAECGPEARLNFRRWGGASTSFLSVAPGQAIEAGPLRCVRAQGLKSTDPSRPPTAALQRSFGISRMWHATPGGDSRTRIVAPRYQHTNFVL